VADVAGQLTAGKGPCFHDRSELALHEFEDPVRAFEVQCEPYFSRRTTVLRLRRLQPRLRRVAGALPLTMRMVTPF